MYGKNIASIYEAINNDSLVIFIGAGVSALAPLPLWRDFAHELLKECENDQIINNAEYKQINDLIKEPKKIITIVLERYKLAEKKDKFYETFRKLLTLAKGETISSECEKIYQFCKESGALVLTTNADLLLDDYFNKENIFYEIDKCGKLWPRTGRNLVKLHGTIESNESLVFTVPQYIERYSNEDFIKYRKDIFNSGKTVVFIGYGANEFELLEHMIRKAYNRPSKIIIMEGFYSYENFYQNAMATYYNKLNFSLFPYNKDQMGYKELGNIAQKLLEEIKKNTDLNSHTIKEIKKSVIAKDIKALKQIVEKCTIYEKAMVDEIKRQDDLLYWLKLLYENGFFCIDGVAENGNRWEVLDLVQSAIKNEDKKDYDEIVVSIINDISENAITIKYTNAYFMQEIIHIIFACKQNVIGNNVHSLLDRLMNHEKPIYNMLLFELAEDDIGFFKWEEKEKKDVIFKIIEHMMKNNANTSDYYLTAFVKNRIEFICNSTGFDLYNHIVNWINENDVITQTEFFHVGAIAMYPEDDDNCSGCELIILCLKWLIEHFENVSNAIVKSSFNEINTSIIGKAYIYNFAINFDKYRAEFIAIPENPFDYWNLYTDLYYLIEKNTQKFTDEERRVIVKWVKSGEFGKKENKEKYYLNIIRQELIGLLLHQDVFCSKWGIPYSAKKHHIIPKIYDRNKIIIPITMEDNIGETIRDNWRKKSINEIFGILSNIEFSYEKGEVEYSNALTSILQDRENILEDDSIEWEKAPVNYYSCIGRALQDMCPNNVQKALKILLDYIVNLIDNREDNRIISQLLFTLENITNKCEVKTEIFCYISEVMCGRLYKCLDVFKRENYDNFSNNTVSFLLNNWFCTYLNQTIECVNKSCDKELQSVLFNFIDSVNKKDRCYTIIIACLMYRCGTIDKMKHGWMNENIHGMLDCQETVAAYIAGDDIKRDGYKAIKNRKKLLLDIEKEQSDGRELIRHFVTQCTYVSIKNNKGMDSTVKYLIEKSENDICISVLHSLSDITDNYNDYKTDKLVLEICSLITNNKCTNIVVSDQHIRCLCNCTAKWVNIENNVFIALRQLTDKFDGYFSEELICFAENRFDQNKNEVALIAVGLAQNYTHVICKDISRLHSIIEKIRNTSELQEEYRKIVSALIEKGEFRYVE